MADRSLCPAALIFALIHVQSSRPPAVASGEPFELLFQLGLAAFGGVAGCYPLRVPLLVSFSQRWRLTQICFLKSWATLRHSNRFKTFC